MATCAVASAVNNTDVRSTVRPAGDIMHRGLTRARRSHKGTSCRAPTLVCNGNGRAPWLQRAADCPEWIQVPVAHLLHRRRRIRLQPAGASLLLRQRLPLNRTTGWA
jgi:hypothetical protein